MIIYMNGSNKMNLAGPPPNHHYKPHSVILYLFCV